MLLKTVAKVPRTKSRCLTSQVARERLRKRPKAGKQSWIPASHFPRRRCREGDLCSKKHWYPQQACRKHLEKARVYSWGVKSSYFPVFLIFLSQSLTWHHKLCRLFHVTSPIFKKIYFIYFFTERKGKR